MRTDDTGIRPPPPIIEATPPAVDTPAAAGRRQSFFHKFQAYLAGAPLKPVEIPGIEVFGREAPKVMTECAQVHQTERLSDGRELGVPG
jgi:hypothetical protein